METNPNNSGLETGSTGYNPGRDTGWNVRNQGPSDTGPGRGAQGGGGINQPVQAAKQFVREGKRVAKDIGAEVGQQARGIAQELKQDIKGSADAYIEQGRERVTGQVGSIAQALHRVSDELRQDQNGAPVARVTDMIAQRLEGAADMLQNKEPRDIIRGIESFARREPALFLGGCLLAGVVISRFLKASSRHDQGSSGYTGGHDEGNWRNDNNRDNWSSGGDSGMGRATDLLGNRGPSGPIDVNAPRGPLDRSGLGGSATPFDVTPRTPETPPEMGGGV